MYKKNYFNFKKIDNRYLLTNDFGEFSFVNTSSFNRLINGKKLNNSIQKELCERGFIYTDSDEQFADWNCERISDYKKYLDYSTTLHIFVVSKNCNFNCIYCQAGNLNLNEEYLMNEEVARKSIDIAFESPSKYLTFEFQGGEPLLNFDIIKYIINFSKEKNKKMANKKEIEYCLVSNLTLLTNEIIDFFIENNVAICTSLDGNRELQNKNRPYKNKDSYEETVKNIKKLQYKGLYVSSLLTTTKYSLNEYKSIVDEYIKLGMDRISIRPLTRLGKASYNWDNVGYSAEEFLDFYKNILDYIIKKNKQGYYLAEGIASILLKKILLKNPINYMELRSPCGATIGQLAYYYDGNIYTCDEGRMLAEMGDKKFLLGSVFNNTYKDLINNDCCKEACKASCLEGTHCCHSCVYFPYCGTCPVVNYAQTGKMILNSRQDYKCKIMTGILDTLFLYIKNDKSALKVFKKWI